jgi:hypothetical protein
VAGGFHRFIERLLDILRPGFIVPVLAADFVDGLNGAF